MRAGEAPIANGSAMAHTAMRHVRAQRLLEQGGERADLLFAETTGQDRGMRAQHLDVWARRKALDESGAVVVARLFEEEHAVMLGEPRKEVLRSLNYEVPAQVGIDHEV
ncbi:MAG TPA: hypothetical protein VFB54_06785 [Burkholderiales bacterium]|nr:hypothetical protein [Burkholderiales bacterium]